MIYEKTLNCGIKLLFDQLDSFRSCSVGIFVRAGSATENEYNNGVSHFLEHMLFKGTEKRSAKKIAEDMDRIGGQINAFTSKEYTCFYVKCTDEDTAYSIDILTDLFLNSIIDSKELEKEKGVIIEEISMYNDTPDDVAHEVCSGRLFSNSVLEKSILGPAENIKKFTRDDLIDYYRKNYTSDRIVICVAGNFDTENVTTQFNSIFDSASITNNNTVIKSDECLYDSCGIIKTTKDIEQTHICIGYPGLNINDEKKYLLSVLNNIYGGSVSSVLYQKIREENGMAYSVYSFPAFYLSGGGFFVYAGTSPDHYEAVLSMINEISDGFSENGISEEQFSQSIQQLKGNLILASESTGSKMMTLGRRYILTGKWITEKEELDIINRLDYKETHNLLKSILIPDRAVISLVGKFK